MIAKYLLAVALLYSVQCEHHGEQAHPPPPPPASSKSYTSNLSSKSLKQQSPVQQVTNQQINNTEYQTSHCEPGNCPPMAMAVLLVLSEKYPDDSFEVIQSFINDMITACESAELEFRFTYTNGRESDFGWVSDEKSFDSIQRTVVVKNFEWSEPPKSKEMAHSIMHMIEMLGASKSVPPNSEK
uniref:Uncharacterized protein n=1 Tax=Plectus sambesii TaxID=2011161 RepID=A0A914WB52_9BILA